MPTAPTLHPFVDMKATQYEIRLANGNDLPFIYATWLESYRYDSHFGKSHRNNIFFEDYRKVTDLLLQNSDVFVAASTDDPDIIYGYLVKEQPNTLHYVFVKGPFRRWGIAKALFFAAFGAIENRPVYYTHKTYTAMPVIDKLGDSLLFRGTALLKSFEGDDEHARTETKT